MQTRGLAATALHGLPRGSHDRLHGRARAAAAAGCAAGSASAVAQAPLLLMQHGVRRDSLPLLLKGSV